jgi:hypothetical protein
VSADGTPGDGVADGSTAGSPEGSSKAARAARANSRQLAYRSSFPLAMPPARTASIARGRPGTASVTDGGGSDRWEYRTAASSSRA